MLSSFWFGQNWAKSWLGRASRWQSSKSLVARLRRAKVHSAIICEAPNWQATSRQRGLWSWIYLFIWISNLENLSHASEILELSLASSRKPSNRLAARPNLWEASVNRGLVLVLSMGLERRTQCYVTAFCMPRALGKVVKLWLRSNGLLQIPSWVPLHSFPLYVSWTWWLSIYMTWESSTTTWKLYSIPSLMEKFIPNSLKCYTWWGLIT